MQDFSTWVMQVKVAGHIDANLFSVRYRNLPAKPAEEAQKHRQQYEEMVAQAKKRGELILQSSQGSLTIFLQSIKLLKVRFSLGN